MKRLDKNELERNRNRESVHINIANSDNNDKAHRIEITGYTDYVPYISDLIKRKKEISGFSFRVFCRKSGFKSPIYLKWVADGVRHISLKSIHKFVAGLSLDKREAQYFTLMVNYKEATDPETKRLYYEQMLNWQHRRLGGLTKEAYEYLSHWYNVAIRELVGEPDFKNDPKWVRDRLDSQLTVWDIKNSFDTLERLKLIKKDMSGNWKQAESDLRTGKEIVSLAAYNYHSEMLELAEKALMNIPASERNFQSLMAVIDKETYQEMKEKIESFQDELVRFLHEKENNLNRDKAARRRELYALNIQFIPLTRRRGGEL